MAARGNGNAATIPNFPCVTLKLEGFDVELILELMREAINNNPVVQMAVLGVLAVVVGLMLMARMSGGGTEAPPAGTDPAAAGAVAPSAGAVAGVDPSIGSGAPTPGVATGAVDVPGGSAPIAAATNDFEAGPGLPRPVVKAYESGKAVVLLVYRANGRAVEDKLVRRSVSELEGDSRLAVFQTRARGVSRYSQITNGVALNRVPALLVIRPKKLNDGTPEVVIRYGFRSRGSVAQAVEDALYAGRQNLPYHPG